MRLMSDPWKAYLRSGSNSVKSRQIRIYAIFLVLEVRTLLLHTSEIKFVATSVTQDLRLHVCMYDVKYAWIILQSTFAQGYLNGRLIFRQKYR